jgi:hypothetical protein
MEWLYLSNLNFIFAVLVNNYYSSYLYAFIFLSKFKFLI